MMNIIVMVTNMETNLGARVLGDEGIVTEKDLHNK
jgi:hypothetical protein